jgi:hypothetical protein
VEDKKESREREGGGREEKERGGILRTERMDGYEVLLGESSCKENGGIFLSSVCPSVARHPVARRFYKLSICIWVRE